MRPKSQEKLLKEAMQKAFETITDNFDFEGQKRKLFKIRWALGDLAFEVMQIIQPKDA